MRPHTLLFIVSWMMIASALTPARPLIRCFALLCFVGALFILYSRYPKAIPLRVFYSGFIFVFVRVLLGWIKGVDEFLIFARDTLGEMLFFILPIGLFCAIVAYVDYKQFLRFVIVSVLMTIPFLVITIFADVGTSRMNMATAEMISFDAMIETYQTSRSGVMMYSAIHTLPFLLVGAVVASKYSYSNKGIKILLMFFSFLILFAIIRSGFGYATGIALALLVLTLIGTRHLGVLMGGLVILAIIVLILLKSGLLCSCLEYIQQGIGHDNVIGGKAGEIISIIEGRDAGDFNARIEKYSQSWATFKLYPFFGGDLRDVGGHAYWIDILGQWGVLGFLPEMIMFLYGFGFLHTKFPMPHKYYLFFIFVFYMILSSVKAKAFDAQNPVIFLFALTLLLLREDVFYYVSNKMRRVFMIPYRSDNIHSVF